MTVFAAASSEPAAVPAHLVSEATLADVLERLPESARRFATFQKFRARSSERLVLPGEGGAPAAVLVGAGTGEPADPFLAGRLADAGDGVFRLASGWSDPFASAVGFGLATYRFDRYRKESARPARLVLPEGVDRREVERIVEGVFLTRDLINTPANDMGPADLADAAVALGRRTGASLAIVEGERLAQGFPMIAAVGAASPRAPRVIDLNWGPPDAPRVTLVGKGVCFDTGGLNLKPDRSMALMKKDMGGAANALGLAEMVIGAGLKLHLRVLVGAVENAIGGRAFRPGDVLKSRKGVSVEIGNTDAEGRLVLADLLALAGEETPELLFDFATLTGAARVGLGPELPALFSGDDRLAAGLVDAGMRVNDPMWRLPLWPGYRKWLDSKVADINHISAQPMAGAITAALFLARFVERPERWAHVDMYAWNQETRAGRPEGGEAQTIRAIYDVLKARYGATA